MINQTAAKLSLIIFELRFWPIKCMQKHPENLLRNAVEYEESNENGESSSESQPINRMNAIYRIGRYVDLDVV